MPDGRTGYIHIKTYILRQFPVAVLATEMSLADMNRFYIRLRAAHGAMLHHSSRYLSSSSLSGRKVFCYLFQN